MILATFLKIGLPRQFHILTNQVTSKEGEKRLILYFCKQPKPFLQKYNFLRNSQENILVTTLITWLFHFCSLSSDQLLWGSISHGWRLTPRQKVYTVKKSLKVQQFVAFQIHLHSVIPYFFSPKLNKRFLKIQQYKVLGSNFRRKFSYRVKSLRYKLFLAKYLIQLLTIKASYDNYSWQLQYKMLIIFYIL